MGFEFNEAEALETGSKGSKVLDTGIYDVTIETASITVASTGTEGIDWSLHVEGAKYPNMVYGMWHSKKDGTKIANGNPQLISGLMALLNVKSLTEFDKTIEIKGGTKVVKAYKEFDQVKVQVAIQKVLGFYNGEVTEKNEIRAFFDKNGKTYAERIKGSEAKQIEYMKSNLKDKEDKDYKVAMANGAGEEEPETDGASLL